MTNQEQKKTIESLKPLIDMLKSSLPKEMPIQFCNTMDPSRAILLREACLFRVTELTESAYTAFAGDKLITAFILCRAFMETETLFWTFIDMLQEALKNRKVENIRTFFDKALTGVKDQELKKFKRPNEASQVLDPHHVLKLIENTMGKKIQSYPLQYASLSEFSHPNAAGTIEAYTTFDWPSNTVRFGLNSEKLSSDLALPQLVVSIRAFIQLYDLSADLIHEFVELCESLYILAEEST